MRLTCPNCGAQYEVPDDVIPQEGRDVQCSNCGTTWFHPHPTANTLEVAHTETADAATSQDVTPQGDELPGSPSQDPNQATPRTRELDAQVKGILQEEAAHETQLRAQEGGGLETQPDLGLDDAADDAKRRANEARARMERLKGRETPPEPEEVAPPAAAKTSRRDRLPDIDEINSSLQQTDTSSGAVDYDDADGSEPKPKRGFARGFAIPLVIAAILVLVYANAPQLAEAVPALGPTLTSFVLTIDQLRVWLDTQISAILP